MNDVEIDGVIEHMTGLFPNWSPSTEELQLWRGEFRRYERVSTMRALKEAAFSTDYNKPPRKTLRKLVNQYQPNTLDEVSEQPEPTIFVMYEGGGRGTLLAGYHFPIIVPPVMADRIRLIAENVRRYYENRIGGLWKVYTDTTQSAMGMIRHGFYKQRADGQNC